MTAEADDAERLAPADVVVIGIGAAGAIICERLAHAGCEVVGLEAGPARGRGDYVFDEYENEARNRLGEPKINGEVPTWRASRSHESTTERAGRIVSLMSNGLGGGSIHYAGAHLRLAPWHFRMRSSAEARYGGGAIPQDSTAIDWPVGYEELERHYQAVEEELQVAGEAGLNPYEGRRSGRYPLPPLRRTGWTELTAEAAHRRGLHPFPGPAAIRSHAAPGRAACTYCGFCTFNGCHVDAKATTSLTHLPAALASGNLRLLTEARVLSIAAGADGLAAGALYLRGGRVFFQPARAVVLCAHSFENTRLLLLSRSAAFPDGLANRSGQVGRNAMSAVYVGVDALFPGLRLNRYGGSWAQCTGLDDFNADNFDHVGLGFVAGGWIAAVHEAKPIATALSTPPSVPRYGSAWKAWLAANATGVGRMIATAESLPYEDSFLDLDPHVRDRHGQPVIRITYRLHDQELRRYAFLAERMRELMLEAGASETWISFPPLPAAPFQSVFGATRMSAEPELGVVDGFCVAHEVPNLVVVGASSFPTSGGYPPTATIQALAARAAERLAQTLARGASG